MTAALERFQTWELLTQRRVLVIAGNHDVPHNRVDLARQSAFGALVASGTINPVWNEPALIGDGWVGGICYPVTEAAIRGWSQKIRERGLAGRPGVMMLHCFADMVGGDIFGEPSFPYLSLAQWLPEASVFHFGHDHQDKGVTRLGDKVFVQVGALLRGTLAEDQVSRQPKLVVVKTHGAAPLLDIPAQVEVEEIPVPIEPAEKVFDLAKREKVVEASTQIDNFVAHLAEVTAQSAGAQVVDVNQLQISEGAKRLVRRYLDHAMGAA
jgi:hypothetical protein